MTQSNPHSTSSTYLFTSFSIKSFQSDRLSIAMVHLWKVPLSPQSCTSVGLLCPWPTVWRSLQNFTYGPCSLLIIRHLYFTHFSSCFHFCLPASALCHWLTPQADEDIRKKRSRLQRRADNFADIYCRKGIFLASVFSGPDSSLPNRSHIFTNKCNFASRQNS